MLDPGVASVLVDVVDVDVARAVLVGDPRDRAHQRRVLDEPVDQDGLALADVRAHLDGEAGVPLEPLVGSHGREAYSDVLTSLR